MVNEVVLMGRLTADPELRQTQSGVSTCTVTVAVDRSYTAQGQERQADFISVVAWRQTAEFISKYFSKGKMIAVVGQLRTRTYDDKRYPDVKHYVTEVYANSVSFCGDSSRQNSSQPAGNVSPAPSKPTDLEGFEEIPDDGSILPF
jgi:single-strand DNA-binding protein